jgi:hypothetical protein
MIYSVNPLGLMEGKISSVSDKGIAWIQVQGITRSVFAHISNWYELLDIYPSGVRFDKKRRLDPPRRLADSGLHPVMDLYLIGIELRKTETVREDRGTMRLELPKVGTRVLALVSGPDEFRRYEATKWGLAEEIQFAPTETSVAA